MNNQLKIKIPFYGIHCIQLTIFQTVAPIPFFLSNSHSFSFLLPPHCNLVSSHFFRLPLTSVHFFLRLSPTVVPLACFSLSVSPFSTCCAAILSVILVTVLTIPINHHIVSPTGPQRHCQRVSRSIDQSVDLSIRRSIANGARLHWCSG